MQDIFRRIDEVFSIKSFLIGLGGVAVLYGSVFGSLAFSSKTSLERLEKQLASHAVLLEKTEAPPVLSSHREPAHEEMVSLDTHAVLAEEDMGAAPSHVAEATLGPEMSIGDDLQALHREHAVGNGLPVAPVDGVYEKTAAGIMPIKNANGQTPFLVYKKPAPLNRDRHNLSVFILDYGLSETISKSALKALPSSVSFLLSPYAQKPHDWQTEARADGHEIWLELPVQRSAFPYDDPGPKGLLADVSLPYNQDRLGWLLSRTSGYAGVASYTDMAIKRADSMFSSLFEDLFGRGLGFIELNTQGGAFVRNIAEQQAAPYAQAHMILSDFSAAGEQIQQIERYVRSHSHTIVLVRPNEDNIGMLEHWLESLQASGIVLVPVSAPASLFGLE